MASCQLKIELDNAGTPHRDGSPVSGTVIVRSTSPTKCTGLEVTTYWSTHGRGNVDRGDIDQTVVFEGEWEADREYRYPFSLKTAAWPPTYYGTYLNVSHFVRARAKVPWASDPKVDEEFEVVANNSPEDLKPSEQVTPKKKSIIGWVIGIVLLVVFGPLLGVLLLVLLPILGIAGGIYWFTRVFLPSQLTGSIECALTPVKLRGGETAQGNLRFTPKRNAMINGISWKLTCEEKCVSGSGSNRTTHRHEVLTRSESLAAAGQLKAGLPQSFEFAIPIPSRAPPSLKFGDNELIWQGEIRIDIPRWPDWVKTFPLTILPAESDGDAVAPPEEFYEPAPSSATAAPTVEEQGWFDEVLEQVSQSEMDEDRLKLVLDAVRDHTFTIRVDILEELIHPPESARNESGAWRYARYRRKDVEIALLFPPGSTPPNEGTFQWCGRAMLFGYDEDLDCLLMRIV